MIVVVFLFVVDWDLLYLILKSFEFLFDDQILLAPHLSLINFHPLSLDLFEYSIGFLDLRVLIGNLNG